MELMKNSVLMMMSCREDDGKRAIRKEETRNHILMERRNFQLLKKDEGKWSMVTC